MIKRLIEDVLPLEELNKYAQKGGGIGSQNAMPPPLRPLVPHRFPRHIVGSLNH